MSDLECLNAAARSVYATGWGALIAPAHTLTGRGVALIDAALVRGLREWREMRAYGGGTHMVQMGRIAKRALPKLGREARRRLGR